MDGFRFGLDEHVFSTAFVLSKKPCQVAKLCEPSDFFYVFKQAGMLVILRPAFYDDIEGCHPVVLIHPSP